MLAASSYNCFFPTKTLVVDLRVFEFSFESEGGDLKVKGGQGLLAKRGNEKEIDFKKKKME